MLLNGERRFKSFFNTGPLGERYEIKDWKASEYFFTALNAFIPSGSDGKSPGVPFLDRLIITHPHDDHVTGIYFLFVRLLLLVTFQKLSLTCTCSNPWHTQLI